MKGETKLLVAEIILNRPTKQLHSIYTYKVPEQFGLIPTGTRVLVPLRNEREEGLVLRSYESEEQFDFTLRPIQSVLDKEPWFTDEMLDTVQKMSDYFLTSYGEILPLFTVRKTLKSYEPAREEWLIPKEGLSVELVPARAKAQRRLIEHLLLHGPVSKRDLRNQFSGPVIKAVSNLPLVSVEEQYKKTKTKFQHVELSPIPLTSSQEAVWQPIQSAMQEGRQETFVLHGITGSGKTQVYIRAAAECLAQDKTAIILVPEIILTDQIVKRFVDVFGDEVVVFHSKITVAERNNSWERLRRKDSHIIIGARSAVFAPATDIGLIVMDEEHDHSYKQEDMTRYHARNVAEWRAEAHSCPLILGSATPSIVSYYKAQQGEYTLLELPNRIFNQPMPRVTIVDMKEELLHGNYSVFSDTMRELIANTLNKREQMIMLLNRRGYSTFVMCRSCGEPIKCPHCDVAMVYHQDNEELKCHYCDYHQAIPKECPQCHSHKIKFFGSGTQKVEEALRKQFPQARIARLDQDVALKKGRGEEVLHQFAQGQFDILLGTQMVSKGHDFPNVTAVGILTADSVLNIPLYTAAERTFDLLTQTAGRAGRGQLPGHVVVQTYNPLNYAIIKSKVHDYVGFYKEEIENRRALRYPPFGHMIHMIVRHKQEEKVWEIGQSIVACLDACEDKQDIEIMGPYEDGVKKVRDLYRLSIMIRGSQLDSIKKYIQNSWIYRQEGLLIDVDPI